MKKQIASLIFIIMIFFSRSPVQSNPSEYNFEIGLNQHTGVFSRIFDTQHQTGLYVATNQSFGKYMIRLRRGFRFEQTAYQWEFESYPIFSDQYYGYLIYAWSDSEIFSQHRAGAELFTTLPFRNEGSLGFRYMNFQNGSQSWIYTGSLNHYYASFLFIFRPYFVYSDGRSGQTFTGSVRHYFNDAGDYVLVRGGKGVSPDQTLMQLGERPEKDILLLRSLQGGIESRNHLTNRIVGQLSIDVFQQELAFDPGSYVINWLFQYGLIYHF